LNDGIIKPGRGSARFLPAESSFCSSSFILLKTLATWRVQPSLMDRVVGGAGLPWSAPSSRLLFDFACAIPAHGDPVIENRRQRLGHHPLVRHL